tara:strand:- start:491 stop:1072 length:582 start_codon:yes stop_codon:yes gene_type:complete
LVDPSLTYQHDKGKRNTWIYATLPTFWGDPLDDVAWMADNPATVVRDNAETIAASGLEIFLEVGDEDGFNLQDGTEFLHRVLWDHDIRHEYHLTRWANHDGLSLPRRFRAGFRFVGAALTGERIERSDLPLSAEEQALFDWLDSGMEGDAPPAPKMGTAQALSMQERMLGPMRAIAKDDPAMARNYAELPPTR